jgi:hypothetical protein
MRLFRLFIQKAKDVIRRIQERERRIAKARAQREWGERLFALMIHIQETCGPFATEAELRGLPDAYAGRTDGTIEMLLKRASKVSIPDPIKIRVEEPSRGSRYLRSKYAIG